MVDGAEPWPRYFRPQPVTTVVPARSARVPACVLDIFRLRPADDTPAELIVVVGCRDGRLGTASGAVIEALPEAMQVRIRAAEIDRRGDFRTLTARAVHLFALESSAQGIQSSGLNDAVSLHGAMQARLLADRSGVRVETLDTPGQLLVGRLDLLGAAGRGIGTAFHNAVVADERIYHLLVPIAPLETIRRGEGLALVYPFLEPMASAFADNSFMLMRLVHGLLYRLRDDLREERGDHPFARADLPVPDRAQLERELLDEGYEIVGDVARRRPDERGMPLTIIGRLRRFIDGADAERVALPPQARPEEYRRLIDGLIAALASADDRAMLLALAEREGDPAPAPPMPLPVPASPPTPLPSRPATMPTATAPRSPRPRPGRRVEQRADWAGDFARPAAPAEPAPDRADWRGDFDGPETAARRSADPVASDSSLSPAPTPAETEGGAGSHWSADFERPPRRDGGA